MKYILSHPRLTASANLLAIKLHTSPDTIVRVRTTPDNNGDCIIRYGNSSYINPDRVNFNLAEHIRLAGNKLRLSDLLYEKQFPHVELFNSTEGMEGLFPEDEDYPIVIREELNRGGGIGIIIHETPEEPFTVGDVWSKWYNFQFELGVHILGGEIVRVFKKVRNEGLEEEKFPIKNTHRGYHFSLRENWKESYTGLENYVKKLYELVPIQFARLDIGYDKETGGYRLIEINSAPDLSQNENTLNIYAKFLAERIFHA